MPPTRHCAHFTQSPLVAGPAPNDRPTVAADAEGRTVASLLLLPRYEERRRFVRESAGRGGEGKSERAGYRPLRAHGQAGFRFNGGGGVGSQEEKILFQQLVRPNPSRFLAAHCLQLQSSQMSQCSRARSTLYSHSSLSALSRPPSSYISILLHWRPSVRPSALASRKPGLSRQSTHSLAVRLSFVFRIGLRFPPLPSCPPSFQLVAPRSLARSLPPSIASWYREGRKP